MEKSQTGCPTRWCIIANGLQYLHEQAASTPKKIKNITSYADDISLTTSHPEVEKLRDIITPYLSTLHDRLESRKLKLFVEKSSATVFTTWNNEATFDPHLTISN